MGRPGRMLLLGAVLVWASACRLEESGLGTSAMTGGAGGGAGGSGGTGGAGGAPGDGGAGKGGGPGGTGGSLDAGADAVVDGPAADGALDGKVDAPVDTVADLPKDVAADAPGLPNGLPCKAASECASGQCRDGVCCDGACTGACMACLKAATGGADGTCAPVLAGHMDGSCVNEGAASCGDNGLCDGMGQCQRYAAGTACAPATCKDAVYLPAGACDGFGSCDRGTGVLCAPYQCTADGKACRTSCSLGAHCTDAYLCIAGSCLSKLPLGSACGDASECGSGFCVDGVCCESACVGSCFACNSADTGKTSGLCRPVFEGTTCGQRCCAGQRCDITCTLTGLCAGMGPVVDDCDDGLGCTDDGCTEPAPGTAACTHTSTCSAGGGPVCCCKITGTCIASEACGSGCS